MDTFFDWALQPINLMILLSGLLGFIVLILFAMLFSLHARLRQIQVDAADRQKQLIKEISLNSPVRAAIAAMIAIGAREETNLTQFQAEVATLTENWEEIEALAEQAHAKLAALIKENEATLKEKAKG